jgi:hypothetical protein
MSDYKNAIAAYPEKKYRATVNAGAQEVNKLMSQLFLSTDEKLDMYLAINGNKERLKGDDKIVQLETIMGKVNLTARFEKMRENVEKIIDLIVAGIYPMDFLESATNGKYISANTFQCGCFLEMVKSEIENCNDNIYIVNASPHFIYEWLAQNIPQKVYFITRCENEYKFFRRGDNHYFLELSKINFIKNGKVFYLPYGFKNNEIENHLKGFMARNCQVIAVLRDEQKNLLCRCLETVTCYRADIRLLPTSQFAETPKKNFVLKYKRDMEKYSEEIITTSFYHEEIGENGKQYLYEYRGYEATMENLKKPRPFRTYIKSAIHELNKSGGRNSANEYVFSKELSVWYTYPTVEENESATLIVYLSEYFQDKQSENEGSAPAKISSESKQKNYRRKNLRGTKVRNSDVKKKLKKAEIKNYIENDGIYHDCIRLKAIEQLENKYNGQPICLKSLWYCYYDKLNLSDRSKEQLKAFATGEAGKLMVGEAEADDYAEALTKVGANDELAAALKQLIGFAVEQKHANVNPLDKIAIAERKNKRLKTSIDNLRRKDFTVEEERTIVDKLVNYIFENRETSNADQLYREAALAILIQLFTGLPTNIIIALRWEDFHGIHATNYRLGRSQLVVNKYYDASGHLRWITDANKCRRLPIMTILTKYLSQVKETKKLGKKDSEISKQRIVGEGISAKKILEAISVERRNMLEHVAGESNSLEVPYGNKTEELDIFNGYKGNRFQKNFENRCISTCGITESEFQFLTMKTITDVFYAHYLDFGDECIQFKLIAKLDRWAQAYIDNGEALESKPPEQYRDTDYMCYEYELKPEANKGHAMRINFTSKKAEIIVKTKYGVEYTLLSEEGD